MSSCFDVYTLAGQGCHIIQTYPSQVHPGGRVRPNGPVVLRERGRKLELTTVIKDDEEALAVALLLLS